MTCPKYQHRMKLMETRANQTTGVIRRRYVCLGGCGHSVTLKTEPVCG